MTDEHGTSWDDGPDRFRHRHQATDRGDYDQWPDQSGGYPPSEREWQGNATQGHDPYGADRYPPGYGQYDQSGYDQGYAGYPPQDAHTGSWGVAEPYGDPRATYPGHVPDPRGYGQDYQGGYQQPGYDQRGYDPAGYDPAGYGGNGHGANGYGGNGYGGNGYPEPGYDRGYSDTGYQAAYQGQPSRGSWIEDGFGDIDAQAAAARRNTGESRRIRTDETDARGRRNTGESRRVRGDETDARGGVPADDDYDRQDKPRKVKKKRRGRSLVVLILVLAMLGGLGYGGLYAWKRFSPYLSTPDYSGDGTGHPTVAVKILKGDSATAIAQTLYTKGVVKSTKAFINAADKDQRSRGIQAGWYKLHTQMSGTAAVAALIAVDSSGKPVNLLVFTVTIPEGMISIDIYAKLAKTTGIKLADFTAAGKDPVALGVDPSWFTAPRDDGRTSFKSIEGFLFPATYTFQPDENAKQILSDMVARFNQEMTKLNFLSVAKNHLQIPPYEALIAASIAQVEAGNATDMRGVTRILYNRIYKTTNAGHTLGLDSEVIYWMRINGKPAKTSDQLTKSELNDPKDKYNTHNVAGFPPGAISSPGEDALKAALSPDPRYAVPYCYFQVVNGKMLYATNYNDFLAQQK